MFDIEQGVADLPTGQKERASTRAVYHADLWGRTHGEVSEPCLEAEKDSIEWQDLQPSTTPYYLFIPQDEDTLAGGIRTRLEGDGDFSMYNVHRLSKHIVTTFAIAYEKSRD